MLNYTISDLVIDDNGTITISDYIDFSYLFERVEA